MLPLLCERLRLPYLGASPILRGLSDDKHLSKRVAVARGLPTAPWAIYRRGALLDQTACPRARRYVIKPNASSASWGIAAAHDWDEICREVRRIHEEGHDAIVEPFVAGHDIEVSVITLDGEPFILPTQIVEQDDPWQLRTYQEKRNLVSGQGYEIRPVTDRKLMAEVERQTHAIMGEYLPFDYGRFEYRFDIETGEVRFMEVNLNCNLWSKKTIAMAASQIGWSHTELIEHLLTESLGRHRLIDRADERVAA